MENATVSHFLQNVLINKNTVKWDVLLGNDFCQQMAKTKKTDTTYAKMNGHFKWYMLQDLIFLEEGVRLKLPVAKRTMTWAQIVADTSITGSIRDSINYVETFRTTTLIANLGISAQTIASAQAGTDLQAYVNFLKQVEGTGDMFAFNCAKAACQVSYELITKALYAASTTATGTLFYDNLIVPNKDYESFKKYDALLDKDQPSDIDKPERQTHYADIFKSAVQYEINFWAASFNNTL